MNDTEPTLVLIPGLLCDEIVWQPVIEAFRKDMAIVVADVRAGVSITAMASAPY